MNTGERVKRLRKKKKLSQTELANILNFTSYTSISKIENNERKIPGDLYVPLANALNTNVLYLMGVSDDPEPATLTTFDSSEDFKKAWQDAANKPGAEIKITHNADGTKTAEIISDPVFDKKLGSAYRASDQLRQGIVLDLLHIDENGDPIK